MAFLVSQPSPPCVLYEDEHLLVINKPPGWNTHAPSPYAGEGIYDWLRNREPRWANLAIIHRLDKSTSGVIVFAKTKLAKQSLTQQFTERRVHKRYVFLTAAAPAEKSFVVQSGILRTGERYSASPHGEPAETKFNFVQTILSPSALSAPSALSLFSAEPLTGRTHQIRVHAELRNIPILGDATYGGAPFPRVCLHAQEITFTHPATSTPMTLRSEPDFFAPPNIPVRAAIIEPTLTDAYRIIHGAADGRIDFYADRFGDFYLAQGVNRPSDFSAEPLGENRPQGSTYFKLLKKSVGQIDPEEAKPQLWHGSPAPDPFTVLENGVRYEISFQQGYSVGLFLDQRDNRRRLLTNYLGPDFPLFENGLAGREVLNTFAYTCGFSVCAAIAGARTTSLDLSKKYLDWGKRNFTLNLQDPAAHDFIFGDLLDWAPRLAKKSRLFDVILLDPPTFSRSKTGIFQAEKHYAKLISAVLPLLRSNGVLFASTNAQKLHPEAFLNQIQSALDGAGRRIRQQQYIPQPPDFPITREEPAYLKTVWLRIS